MRAKSAKRLAKAAVLPYREELEKELSGVCNAIKRAALMGQIETDFDCIFDPYVATRLEKLGYSLFESEGTTMINWENPK